MEFTNQQKLIITLLTDIHAKLNISDSVDPHFVQRAVNDGQGWALDWKYPGIFQESEEDPQEVGYVAKVLEMWSVLESSFKSLDGTQKKELAEAAKPFGDDVIFPGFDGNNESELLGIARIFVDDLDRWTEFSGRVNNSHMQTTDGYSRMLEHFQNIRKIKNENHEHVLFSAKEIAQVLNGRRYPDSV